ncbi:hypothetical protein HHK36_028616 [Tetracentron sinense]|uniref:Myb-like domain-containing protein n=1 Tax=Tetracentron sinense TaxID=13715 RepID=A0A834YG42_TETSI|nr:hypothetical protein HHK36_028616 [Tetracentron sinense]
MAAASSSSPQDPSTRPTPQPSRRLPPPCWTHEETVALIDAYREKWYSLRRGNLKASHWEEVSDSVALQCPLETPSKTSVQCRHKIEKLRKRYRNEKQRSLTTPNRFSSSWVFFKKLDSMEKGPSSTVDSGTTDGDDDNDDDHDGNNRRSGHRPVSNGGGGGGGREGGGGGGFRVRFSGGVSSIPSFTGFRSKIYDGVEENENPSWNPGFLNGCSSSRSGFGKRGGDIGGKREMDPVAEMVSAIKLLGEGFLKMEQMKIEMGMEVERMRMEMEMKRTEMILESQQQIVDAFAKGLYERTKKAKRMPSPDS